MVWAVQCADKKDDASPLSERAKKIKRAIERGEYRIDLDSLAEKLIEELANPKSDSSDPTEDE